MISLCKIFIFINNNKTYTFLLGKKTTILDIPIKDIFSFEISSICGDEYDSHDYEALKDGVILLTKKYFKDGDDDEIIQGYPKPNEEHLFEKELISSSLSEESTSCSSSEQSTIIYDKSLSASSKISSTTDDKESFSSNNNLEKNKKRKIN